MVTSLLEIINKPLISTGKLKEMTRAPIPSQFFIICLFAMVSYCMPKDIETKLYKFSIKHSGTLDVLNLTFISQLFKIRIS
jgi:hypothetical protein